MRGKEAAKSAQLRERTAEQRAASAADELAAMRVRVRAAEDALRTSVAEAEGLRVRVRDLEAVRAVDVDRRVAAAERRVSELERRSLTVCRVLGTIFSRYSLLPEPDEAEVLRANLSGEAHAAMLGFPLPRSAQRKLQAASPGRVRDTTAAAFQD